MSTSLSATGTGRVGVDESIGLLVVHRGAVFNASSQSSETAAVDVQACTEAAMTSSVPSCCLSVTGVIAVCVAFVGMFHLLHQLILDLDAMVSTARRIEFQFQFQFIIERQSTMGLFQSHVIRQNENSTLKYTKTTHIGNETQSKAP